MGKPVQPIRKTVSVPAEIISHLEKKIQRHKQLNHFTPSIKEVLEKIIVDNYKAIEL